MSFESLKLKDLWSKASELHQSGALESVIKSNDFVPSEVEAIIQTNLAHSLLPKKDRQPLNPTEDEKKIIGPIVDAAGIAILDDMKASMTSEQWDEFDGQMANFIDLMNESEVGKGVEKVKGQNGRIALQSYPPFLMSNEILAAARAKASAMASNPSSGDDSGVAN